jgi:hypothetical protein
LAGLAVGAAVVWGVEPARLVAGVGTPAEIGVDGTDPPGLGSVTVPPLLGVFESPDPGLVMVAAPGLVMVAAPGLVVVAAPGKPAPGVVAAPVAGIVVPWLAAMGFVDPPARRVDGDSAKLLGAAWYDERGRGDVDGRPAENPWFEGLDGVGVMLGPSTPRPATSIPLAPAVPGTIGTLAGLEAAELSAAGVAGTGAEAVGLTGRLLTPGATSVALEGATRA